MTKLSVLIEARLIFPTISVHTPPAISTITVPSPVMPLIAKLKTCGPPLSTTVVAPAVPLKLTSVLIKSITSSLKVAVKLIGLPFVGST